MPIAVASGPSTLIKDHLAGGASRLAALLLPQILPVFSVVAPCHPGAALRDLVLVQGLGRELYTLQQRGKPRIESQRIEPRIDLHPQHPSGPDVECLIEPAKRFIFVEPRVRDNERIERNLG